MNVKRIAELARGMARRPIYALIACTALALTLYSFSQPPAPPQTNPPPTDAIVEPPLFPQPTSAPPQTNPLPTSTPIPNFLPLPADAQFAQITAGKYHACGLQADGAALCWGDDVNGSLGIPSGLNFRRISAGLNFTCGLREDSAIVCWGDNAAGQASPPDGSFDEIAAGRDHACALDDGVLICWGDGFPDGAETIQEIPPLSAIQAGLGFTCGLTHNNDMACWHNHNRELSTTPGPFVSLGVGLHYACAIRVDGSVFCGEKYQDRYPQHSQQPTKFVQISGGWHHICGITDASSIECWIRGAPDSTNDQLVSPEGKFTSVSLGWRNSCALSPDGYATCWRQPDIQTPRAPYALPIPATPSRCPK